MNKEELNLKTTRFALVYDPELDFHFDSSPVCRDNQVHIRLKRNFDVIAGFEDKLTYMMTLLINSFYKNMVYSDWKDWKTEDHSFDEVVNLFKETEAYKTILTHIQSVCPTAKDIKFLPAYKSKHLNDQLAFKFEYDDHELELLSYYNFTEYLFDPNYYLLRMKDRIIHPDRKFIRKKMRKRQREEAKGIARKHLWEAEN